MSPINTIAQAWSVKQLASLEHCTYWCHKNTMQNSFHQEVAFATTNSGTPSLAFFTLHGLSALTLPAEAPPP